MEQYDVYLFVLATIAYTYVCKIHPRAGAVVVHTGLFLDPDFFTQTRGGQLGCFRF